MQHDPFALDRKLRDVARAWLAWRLALRRGSGEDHRFERLGAFASSELVRELRAASAADPLAPALAEWVERLYLESQTRDLVLARERAFRSERRSLTAPEAGKFTLRELLGAALVDTKGARRGWLSALVENAGDAGDFELRRWERRSELSNQLGHASLDATELPADDIVARARSFLEETKDASSELGAKDFASLLEVALGRDSLATWPSRLTARSLAALFDETKWLAGLTFDLEELPQPLGASSFLRGLVGFGAAVRSALASPALPFVTAHHPFDLAGATHGALFALVPFGESFARRKLGVARSGLADHRRLLARALLVGARTLALRVVLRHSTLAGSRALRRDYPELVFSGLGVELGPRAAAVLVRSRVSDPHRFAGLVAAAGYEKGLEEVHDEDWYRNPRAVEELRESARQPVERRVDAGALDRGARELSRLFAKIA